MAAPRNTRRPAMATSSMASPSTRPTPDRVLMPNASALAEPRPTTTVETSSAIELARMRRSASPISARSLVRMAEAMVEMATNTPARAGAMASMAATPATANTAGPRYTSITRAARIAAAPDPASDTARLGSLPSIERSAPATPATAHDTASTDHTDCTMATAAGGAVVDVCVSHDENGHSASRPATPINKRTEPTTSDRTVQPGFVWRMGISADSVCVPYLAYSHAIPHRNERSVRNGSASATRARVAATSTPQRCSRSRYVIAPAMAQKPNSSARSPLISTPTEPNSSSVTTAWNLAAPGSDRPSTWCQPSAAMMHSSITPSAAMVRWSTWRISWMPKVWKLVGPWNATDMSK